MQRVNGNSAVLFRLNIVCVFFIKLSTDLPKAVTLDEPNEVIADNITLRWNRSEDAPNYRVYQMIDNQDAQWKRVRTTTDSEWVVRVERGKSYQFKVTGVNGNLEGKESNIIRVTVPGEIKFVFRVHTKDIIK